MKGIFDLIRELLFHCIFMDPVFFAITRFPLKRRDSFFYLKKPFLENGLESLLIFVFILKGKTK